MKRDGMGHLLSCMHGESVVHIEKKEGFFLAPI